MIGTGERVALVAWAALAAVLVLWLAVVHPPTSVAPPVALGLALAPLALPLLAWRQGVRRMLLWAGIVALPYFCHGVMEAWSTPAVRGLAALEALTAAGVVLGLWTAVAAERRHRRD